MVLGYLTVFVVCKCWGVVGWQAARGGWAGLFVISRALWFASSFCRPATPFCRLGSSDGVAIVAGVI